MPLHLKLCAEPDEVETDHLFRQFVESVGGDVLLLLDRSGNSPSWNNGAQRIKGYAPDEIVGRHFSCFYLEDDIAGGRPERALDIAARKGTFEEIGPDRGLLALGVNLISKPFRKQQLAAKIEKALKR